MMLDIWELRLYSVKVMNNIKFVIKNEHVGLTPRDILLSFGLGKPKVHEIYMNKLCFINGYVSNFHEKLNLNDVLEFNLSMFEKVDFEPYDRELDVIYEDEHLLVVNKPKNIIIHPGDEKDNKTLSNMVANYYLKNNKNHSVRYIHRIDKDTTGIVVFTKNILANAIFDKMIRENTFKRYYLAVIHGKPKNIKGTINLPIGKDRHISNKYLVTKNGQIAITHYDVVKTTSLYSVLSVLLDTGRTHQIRVHFSQLNLPLVGDEKYGGSTNLIKRPALHSSKIEFYHPFLDENMTIECNVPLDIDKLL